MREYRSLKVWQKANNLAHKVYDLTSAFPKEERYGLTSQLQRAALSVPTNIVEGSYSSHYGEFYQFLNIALRSLGETSYLLEFSMERKLISNSEHLSIHNQANEVERMLAALLANVKKNKL
jgi:four helix bundle protein